MPELNLKWEVLLRSRGTVLELTDSPVKLSPKFIQVAEGNYSYQGQEVQPDIKVQSLSDLSIFSSRYFDFIILQRDLSLIKPEELKRVLKLDGKVLYIGPDPSFLKMKLVEDLSDINLFVLERA
jgi:hypothetical protein